MPPLKGQTVYAEPEDNGCSLKIEITVSVRVDTEELCNIFEDEGVHVDGVREFIAKSVVSNEVVRYLVHVAVISPDNLWSAAEGAGLVWLLQRLNRAIIRHRNVHPDVATELSIDAAGLTRRRNYLMPEDPEQLKLATEAVAEDMRRSTPPYEKWWRRDHGWLTAEEGWQLDGYGECDVGI
jgi:hypothetical protein